MEITGKLIQKLPVQSGVSSSGNNWSKAEFVIETVEQYPKKVCANLWGDRAKALDQYQLGSLITVSFDLKSREYNGRWYTDVKAWKVEAATPAESRARLRTATAGLCASGLRATAAADVSAARLPATTAGLCSATTARLSSSTSRICACSATGLRTCAAASQPVRATSNRHGQPPSNAAGDVRG